jgi:hypothetical protein
MPVNYKPVDNTPARDTPTQEYAGRGETPRTRSRRGQQYISIDARLS